MAIVAAGHRLLELTDHIRVKGMILLAMDVLQKTALNDGLARLPGHGRQLLLVLLEIVEPGTLDSAGHTLEAQVNDIIGQTDRLKQLGATIGSDGGNSHLRQYLQQPFVDALPVVILGINRIHQQFAGTDQVVQNLVSQVRIDRCCTKTEEHGEMMGIASPTGFNNDVGIATQSFLDQMVVDRTGCHQGIDRQFTFLQIFVGEDQQHLTIPDGLFRFLTNLANRLLQSLFRAVAHGNTRDLETRALIVGNLEELGRRQNRCRQNNAVCVIGGFLEYVALGTQTGLQGHDNRLTQRVNRRVGHLGELLPEVVRHVAYLAREHGHWGIVAH